MTSASRVQLQVPMLASPGVAAVGVGAVARVAVGVVRAGEPADKLAGGNHVPPGPADCACDVPHVVPLSLPLLCAPQNPMSRVLVCYFRGPS